jgi:hypothetical protein
MSNMALAGTPRWWMYVHATDAMAAIDASGYFTNGYDIGMRDGDLLFGYEQDTKIWSTHTVTVSGTTVNLADGTIIGSTTNSD